MIICTHRAWFRDNRAGNSSKSIKDTTLGDFSIFYTQNPSAKPLNKNNLTLKYNSGINQMYLKNIIRRKNMKEERKLLLNKTTVVKLDSLSNDEKRLVIGGSKCCATCHCGSLEEEDNV